MMPSVSQESEKPPDAARLLLLAQDLLAQYAPAMDGLREAAAAGDGRSRVAVNLAIAFRDLAAALARAEFAGASADALERRQLAAENDRLRAELEQARDQLAALRPRRGRHGQDRPLWPRAVQGVLPAALLGAGLHHGARHAVTTVLTAAAASSAAAAGIIYMQPAPEQHHVSLPHPSVHRVTVSPSPSSSLPVLTVQVPAPKGKHHKMIPASPSATPPPSQEPPDPSPAQAVTTSPAGVLTVQQAGATLTLRPSPAGPGMLSAQITIAATGPAAVYWHADPGGLEFDDHAGILGAGQITVITASIAADQVRPGQAWTVTFSAKDQPDQVVTIEAG